MANPMYVSFKAKKQGQLKAESKKTKRSDKWCEIVSLELGSDLPIDPKSGRPKGQRTHHPLKITKEIGLASPQLIDAHYHAELFDEVVIELTARPPTGAGESVVERITLTNALISQVHRYTPTNTTDATQHDTDLLEEFSFAFQKIEISNIEGSTSTSDDITTNNT